MEREIGAVQSRFLKKTLQYYVERKKVSELHLLRGRDGVFCIQKGPDVTERQSSLAIRDRSRVLDG